jgi:hypothetical protein
MSRLFSLGLMLVLAPLAACGDKQGTSFTLNASDDGDNSTVVANGSSGEVSLNVPGFSGKIALPKVQLSGDDVDMNGVHLYPGSKVTAMNVDAKKNSGAVHIGFDSPADPQTVRGWFRQKLTAANFTVRDDANGLSGKTNDGKPFSMTLAHAGAGHTKGDLTVSG